MTEAEAQRIGGGSAWRLWALLPVLLLAVVVGLFVVARVDRCST